MKIECLHGYYKFSEVGPGELSEFASMYGFELERNGDHFTFSDLVDAPNYSLLGGLFLKSPCLFTIEGPPGRSCGRISWFTTSRRASSSRS
jgi:hypothetical protein